MVKLLTHWCYVKKVSEHKEEILEVLDRRMSTNLFILDALQCNPDIRDPDIR